MSWSGYNLNRLCSLFDSIFNGMKEINTMKAAQINQYGQPDLIYINKKALSPVSSTGRVLIEVHAAGVNHLDWKIQEGFLKEQLPLRFPITLGLDFSGVIIHVGEGVSSYKAGDEVYGQSSFYYGYGGSFAEFVSADVKCIAPKPRNKSHVDAATLPLSGVSVYRALIEHMQLKRGQKILIHGGAGHIGSMAIQLAKFLGAMVATTVSPEQLRFVRKLKVDEIIDYTSEDFDKKIQNYDAVLDTVGGEIYYKSLNVLRQGGIIVSFIERPIPKQIEELGINAVYQFTQVTDYRLNELKKLVEQGVFHVPINKTFSLNKAADALHYQKTKKTHGKVVIKTIAHPRLKKLKAKLKKIF